MSELSNSNRMRNESIRVLIIDDDPDVRCMLTEQLKSWFYQVDAVETASEGLTFTSQENPDIILLDFKLPDMNGQDFLEKFRKDDQQTDILVISGEVRPNEEHQLRQEELAYTVLEKPVQPHVLEKYLDMLSINAMDRRFRRESGNNSPTATITMRYHYLIYVILASILLAGVLSFTMIM